MNIAVLLAGGSGKRMGGPEPKQFIQVADKTILEHSIRAFSFNEGIDEIVIVSHADFLDRVQSIAMDYPKVKHIVPGGKERYDSSLAAIELYKNRPNDNLLIHDAVRCLVSQRVITDCVNALKKFQAVDVAIACTDTICEINEAGHIARIPARSTLRNVQTPQGFRVGTIAKAYELGLKDPQFVTTDDAGVVHRYLPEVPIFVIDGESTNIKITFPEDLILAEKLLTKKK